MQEGHPEQLFERYRERGDVDALGTVFDLLAPELLSLSVRLAPSVAEAEDLVQTTFLALIERPRAFKRGARLMPFLVGVLARQAGTARRRARRVPDPARLAQRDAERPEHAAHAAEIDAELRAALERVPELYREVLRQHLLEGRRPIEIALRIGRTPGTVAQQLLRGLEQLRRILPRGLATGLAGGAGLLLATRGEAAVRAAVVHRAGELASASLGVGLSLATIGGALVSFKSVAAAAALGVAIVAWIAWPEEPTLTVQPVVAAPNDSAPLSTGSAGESTALAATRVSATSEVPAGLIEILQPEPPVAMREATLIVRLHGVAPQHVPEFIAEAQRFGEPVTGRFDAAGTARLSVGALLADTNSREPLSVTAKHPLYLDGHELVRWPDNEAQAFECVLTPRAASTLAGRVRVPHGADVSAVRITLSDERGDVVSPPQFLASQGSCDADGRFELKLTAAGLHRLSATSPETLPCEFWCALEACERLELPDIELEAGGAEILGTARIPEGAAAQPFDGIAVHAYWLGAPVQPHPRTVIDRSNVRSFAVLRGGPRPTTQFSVLANDGSFALRGLDAGPWELEVHGVAASALLALPEPRIVHAPATGVVLWDDRCLLTVQVVDAASGPVDGVEVTWGFAQGTETLTYTSQQTFTDAQGRATVVGALVQDYSLTVRRTGSEPTRVEWPALGRSVTDTKRVELPESTASTLVLRLSPGAVELATAKLRLEPKAEGKSARDLRASLASGAYRFDQLEPGAYRAFLGPSDDNGPVGFYGELVQTADFDVEVPPATTKEVVVNLARGGRVRIDVQSEPAVDNWILLELYGPDGVARPFTGVARLDAGEGFGTFASMRSALHLAGSNAIQEALPPGRYELRRAGEDWLVEAPIIEVRAGEVTTITLVARKR